MRKAARNAAAMAVQECGEKAFKHGENSTEFTLREAPTVRSKKFYSALAIDCQGKKDHISLQTM